MNARFITAIALNTLGACGILIGANLPHRTAAIATTSVGYGISVMGIVGAISNDSRELLRARREAFHWAQEAQRHLVEKRNLLLKLEELEERVQTHEAQWAIARAFLEMDDEWIEKMEQAELN